MTEIDGEIEHISIKLTKSGAYICITSLSGISAHISVFKMEEANRLFYSLISLLIRMKIIQWNIQKSPGG